MRKYFVLATALLAGCAIAPQSQTPTAVYDFGLQRSSNATLQPRLQASLLVADAASPAGLDSPAIQYRLAYHDIAQSHVYANSRWATAPGALLTQRIRSRLAAVTTDGVVSASDGARADYALRLELEEFTQVFDTPDKSRVVIRLRASLVERHSRALLAQQSFNLERPAPTANAAGAVHALTEASDELAGNLIAWLATKLEEEKKKAVKKS